MTRAGGLTEHAQAVVHRHDDDVAVGGQDAGVEHVPRALHEGAAVDEEHHRLLTAVPDIYTHTHTHTHAHTGWLDMLMVLLELRNAFQIFHYASFSS